MSSEMSEGSVPPAPASPSRIAKLRKCWRSSRFWRYCMSGCLHNCSSYWLWTLIPLVAQDLGATPWQLGLLNAVGSLFYTVMAVVCGSLLMPRVRVGILARIAVVGCLIASTGVMFTPAVWVMFCIIPISSSTNALYWPSIQDSVGKEAGSKADSRISFFSVSHALGKSVAFLIGGVLKGAIGVKMSFVALMVVVSSQFFYVPWGDKPEPKKGASASSSPAKKGKGYVQLEPVGHDVRTSSDLPDGVSPPTNDGRTSHDSDRDGVVVSGGDRSLTLVDAESAEMKTTDVIVENATSEDGETEELAKGRVFLYMSWVMNWATYGSMGIAASLYIKLINDRNIGLPFGKNPKETFYGAFMCSVYFAQMCVFLIGGAWHSWMFSRLFVFAIEAVGVACFMAISFLGNAYALLGVGFCCGIVAGSGYLSSYSYSFKTKYRSGKMVGLHEAILASSSVILPPAAGAVASLTKEPRTPYWIACCVLGLTIPIQECMYHIFWRIWRRSHPNF